VSLPSRFQCSSLEENTTRLDASVFLSRLRLQGLSTGKTEIAAAHDSKEKAQLAPGFHNHSRLELLDYSTTFM
jgi:hypothetical protein